MYIVIFKSEINTLDQDYFTLAKQLRKLAFDKYHCIDFISLTENNQEITLSYWKSEKDILAWKKDALHIKAQQLGKNKWYKHYQVQIVKILREYNNS